jgi:predicted Zn-dependent peptidase
LQGGDKNNLPQASLPAEGLSFIAGAGQNQMKNSIQCTRLANGLRVITERMSRMRSISIGIWIRSGSADESKSEKGLSHFLEHMLFKGTCHLSAKEIAQSLESLGGSLNASTGKELSVYTAHVVDEHAPIAVKVLADLLQNPRLSGKDIELERNVILTEINHALEDPEETALDYLYLQLFPNHPMGHFIYGSAKLVKSFQRRDFVKYLAKHYTAGRMVIAAAGNVDHAGFVKLVEKAFKALPEGHPAPAIEPLPDSFQPLVRHEFPTLQQAHIALGARLCSYHDEKKYGLLLLDVMFGGGMSSRLFQNIREKYGFAYSVYSFVDLLSTTGVFGIYLGCEANKLDLSVELLHREINKLNQHQIKQEELDMVKSQVKGSMILGLEGSASRMRRIGENEIYNMRHLTPPQALQKIEKITLRQIHELVDEFLHPTRFATMLIVPRK